jgi:pimeloyl-ACP methyl ester carboxylesterase
MHIGFSYVGLIYLVMLMVPNIFWAKNKPKDYDRYVKNENKVLLAFERVGEILVSIIALVFSDFNLREWTEWCTWLVLSFLLMVLYELYWIRYFKSEKTMRDQYSSFCGFPVAGASLPVIAFFLLGIYGVNVWMIVSVLILGIGHIGIHLAHKKEAVGEKKKSRLPIRILKWTGAVVLILFFGAISFVIGVRNVRFINHQANYIHGVDESTYINLGGQNQYVLMMGRNVENPVIINLHGGPASPDTTALYTFSDYLMDDFTIVGWDQRGAGRTYYKNKNADEKNTTATFEQALSDLDELVDYVRARFNKDKVIIMGHSYGTVLGSRYVLMHPEKVSDYIAVGSVVSVPDGDILSYEDALAKAKAAGDDTSEMEDLCQTYWNDRFVLYEVYHPKNTLQDMLALREPVSKYHPAKEANDAWNGLSSPYFGVADLKWFSKSMFSLDEYIELNRKLFDFIMNYDARNLEKDFQMPVHFISGSEDWICPVQLVREYMDSISAPEKSISVLDGCGHAPQFASPKEFADIVKICCDYK